jgi:hypothetical protein
MDYEFEKRWADILLKVEEQFGAEIDVEALLFLIGVQELGQGQRRFKKDEKLNLMHIGICTVLSPFGYYEFSHFDDDRWPHFEVKKKLPYLTDREQKELMKRAILEYFEEVFAA